MTLARCPAVEEDTYPTDWLSVEQWLAWKATDDRKIPRAPYAYPESPDRFVNAQDADVWTDFETAREWASKLPGFGLAFVIRDRDTYPDEELVLIDYDDARDPERGAIHPLVREHIETAGSYADVSTSGTGVHILCRGELPEGVQSITDDLPADEDFPDAEIEVYDSARFVAMTGQHLQGTPPETTACQEFLDDLAGEYATVTANRPDELRDDRWTPTVDLDVVDTVADIRLVYNAISQTRPRDVRLRSTETEERSDGSKSLDPSWTTSKSGTRLAEVDDGWIYRDGMIKLDALQVVALEEGIITDERDYPSEEAFWQAVDALRERGAHIPDYEPADDVAIARDSGARDASVAATPTDGPGRDTHPVPETSRDASVDAPPADKPEGETQPVPKTAHDESIDATSTDGPDASSSEQVYLEEKVSVLESTIEEQRETIERQQATIDRQVARIEMLQAELDEVRAGGVQRDRDERVRRSRPTELGPWERVKRWLG